VDVAESHVERLPLAGLSGLVRTVWVQRTGSLPYVQRNLPTGGAELHVRIGAVPRLTGPLTVAAVEVLPPRTTVVGIRFWPGAASSILGLPADELVDQTVRLDDLWGAAAVRVGEALAEAPGPEQALALLQRRLAARYSRATGPDPLVTEAVRRLMPWRPVEISTLTTQLAISVSQLRRRFLARVGVGPKTLQRTLRFQGYLALAQAAAASDGAPGRPIRLADLAAEAGYADHAHLARECLRLTGLTPQKLLGGRADFCGCGHDHTASFGPFLAGRRAARSSDAHFVQAVRHRDPLASCP
jgi:AraC-like DNA-binding protein